jgi:hypothetical protein
MVEQALVRFFSMMMQLDGLLKFELHSRLVGKVVILLLNDPIPGSFINTPRCVGQILNVKVNADPVAKDITCSQVQRRLSIEVLIGSEVGPH